MHIRIASNADSPVIIDLIFNIWVNENQFDVKREDFPDLIDVEKYYLHNRGLFFVAESGEEVIGTIACNELYSGKYVLKRMFLAKTYRGQGVAQSLLDKLIEQIIVMNQGEACVLYLSTKEKEAARAKQFYLKNGFVSITKEALPLNFPYFYLDDCFMVKTLASSINQPNTLSL